MRNIHTMKTSREPIKGDILLRHIWKNNPNECISWWRYNETIDIDSVKQYTTLNGTFRDMYQSFEVRNLYITINGSFSRDEYVTDGIEVIKATPKLVNAQGLLDRRQWKKIVLTTDPDLIAAHVKSAGDEFLDWFVKNSACEAVEVRQRPKVKATVKGEGIGYFANGYDIIIPKKLVQIDQDNPITKGSTALVYKQETIEEVAERLVKEHPDFQVEGMSEYQNGRFNGIIEGAKLQQKRSGVKNPTSAFVAGVKYNQERSYSDEEVLDILKELEIECVINPRRTEIREWFEKYKKK